MDDSLELRLIESGFNPRSAREVTLQHAGEVIRVNMFSKYRENSAGLLIFDGYSRATVESGIGSSIIQAPVAITGVDRGGLLIYHFEGDLEKRNSSFVRESKGTVIVVSPNEYPLPNILNLMVQQSDKKYPRAKIHLYKSEKTTILYFLPIEKGLKDKLFCHSAGQKFG